MNVPANLPQTKRRATLRSCKPGRALKSDYRRAQEEKERGSPLPALIALGLLGLGVWLGLIWIAK